MLKLLNVINIFGLELNLDESKLFFWFLVTQCVLIVTVIILISIIIGRAKNKNVQPSKPAAAPVAREDVVDEVDIIEDASEPEVVEEVDYQSASYSEEFATSKVQYNMSFTARLIQAGNECKYWYGDLKNELLCYSKTKARMSWKRETFKAGQSVVAKLSFRGKTLCLYLPLNAADFVDSKYQLEDVSDNLSYADTPAMYRLKSARRVKYAIELIEMIAQKLGLERIEHTKEDFYLPYEGIVELINKGLVKRTVRTVVDKAAF